MFYVHQKIGDFMLQKLGKDLKINLFITIIIKSEQVIYVLDIGMRQRGFVCDSKSELCRNLQSVYNTTKQ
jgi:hypothetical protein